MALEIVFWVAVGLIVYAHLGYPLLLRGLVALFGERGSGVAPGELPRVSLIVPAHDEEGVIERKLANARALDYPEGCLGGPPIDDRGGAARRGPSRTISAECAADDQRSAGARA
jgi:cellulose synthase/poly-beta-1,6-N-acetylglucosamine synthase-like glycosyltransferase